MSVSTRLKRMTAGALVTLALFAGGLLALPLLVSEHEARAAVARSLKAVTGVEPEIGSTQLVLLPRPAIRMEGVRIDDGLRPAFTARSLQASIRILPLLVGRAEIAGLVFEQPHLAVKAGPDGAFVLGLPLRTDMTAAEIPLQPEIRFVDGFVRFQHADDRTFETISMVDCALVWSGTNLTATGTFHWRSVPTRMSLSIVDVAALERGERSGVRLRLDSEPIRIAFDGGMIYLNGLQADGALSADARLLRNALALVPIAPLTRDGFGPFKMKAQATLTPTSLALNGLAMELDGNRAEGGLTLRYDGSRTMIQATIASESTDFTPYSGGFSMTGENGRDWSQESIDFDVLDTFDLDLRLSSRRVIVRKTEFGRVAAAATLRNGTFALSVGEAQFYGGLLRGRASLNRRGGAEPEFKVEATITDFDLQRGLVGLAGINRLEGSGTLALSLSGRGEHVHAIAHNLSGTMTLNAAQGRLNGISVEQVLRRLERQPLSGIPDFIGGRTAFDQMIVKLGIAQGTAKIEEASVESALVRLRLAGETSVARRNFDLTGTATLVQSEPAADAPRPFNLPFLVQGPWDKPFLMPDPLALIQRSGAAAPLLDAARRQAARDRAAADDAKADQVPAIPATSIAAPSSE